MKKRLNNPGVPLSMMFPLSRLAVVLLLLLVGPGVRITAFAGAPDPTKVQGDKTCVRCHEPEINQWRATPHYRTFDTLHRTPEAKQIVKRLGFRSVKRNETCVRCHYTQQEVRGKLRVVAGVSCESCHGAAAGWLERHADYGGPDVTKAMETPQHRRERRAASVAAGMNNPTDLYLIARQCLECHTTPDERLVNEGGHVAGTADFELVSWSQGLVRHNFQQTEGQSNAPSSIDRLRVMYIVGQLADLEASLRAVAKATVNERFGQSAAARAARVKQNLWKAHRRLDHPILARALEAVGQIDLRLENSEATLTAADVVGRAAAEFSRSAGDQELSGIDELIPAPSRYK